MKGKTKFEVKVKCANLSNSSIDTYCKINGFVRGCGTYGCGQDCRFYKEKEE